MAVLRISGTMPSVKLLFTNTVIKGVRMCELFLISMARIPSIPPLFLTFKDFLCF